MKVQEVFARFRRSAAAQFLSSLCAAAVFFFLFWQYGKAGDCKPHEIDGQCGMSTAFGFVYGVFGAIVILLISTLAIWSFADRRKELREEQGGS